MDRLFGRTRQGPCMQGPCFLRLRTADNPAMNPAHAHAGWRLERARAEPCCWRSPSCSAASAGSFARLSSCSQRPRHGRAQHRAGPRPHAPAAARRLRRGRRLRATRSLGLSRLCTRAAHGGGISRPGRRAPRLLDRGLVLPARRHCDGGKHDLVSGVDFRRQRIVRGASELFGLPPVLCVAGFLLLFVVLARGARRVRGCA